MLKLTKNIDQSIPVSQMKDGDVAVIVGWKYTSHIGEIVQRYGQHLIVLGGCVGFGWSDYFTCHTPHFSCRVRILESGETLTVE